MNKVKLGRVQRKIIGDMMRYGNGIWQPHWFTTGQMRRCFGTLVARGLIEPVMVHCDLGNGNGTEECKTYRLVESAV